MSSETEQAHTVLATMPKNKREEVRVTASEYRGQRLISVRAWYRDGEEFKPGKGLTIQETQLPDLIRALRAAEKLKRAAASDRHASSEAEVA